MTRPAAGSPRVSPGRPSLAPRAAGGLARTSLFGRRIPPTRREALSLATLPVDREAIRKDAQGFDDVDAFFAPSLLSPAPHKGGDALRTPGESPARAQRPRHAPSAEPEMGVPFDFRADVYAPAHYDAHYDAGEVPVDFGADFAVGGLAAAVSRDASREGVPDASALGAKTPPKRSPGRPRKHPRPDSAPAPDRAGGRSVPSVDDEISAALFSAPATPSKAASSAADESSSSLSPAKTRPARGRPGRPRKAAAVRPRTAQKLADRLLLPQSNARLRVAPLKFWMNERIVRRPSESSAAPVVDVVRSAVPDETEVPRRAGRRRALRRDARPSAEPRSPGAAPAGPAPGFVEKVRVECRTIDYESNRETTRTVAIGPDEVDAPLISGESFGIQTLFTEGGFVSAGVLRFPPGAAKPPRNSSRHALLFHVVRGAFEVTLHRQAFVVGAGCHFVVPRGNHYALRATWPAGDSELFFCHCRDASVDD